jgi:hypothetical protein
MLVDGRDSNLPRTGRSVILDSAIVDRNFARVRCYRAGENLDEGRFPGAVFSHQRVCFTSAQIEGHFMQGANPRVGFRDGGCLEQQWTS